LVEVSNWSFDRWIFWKKSKLKSTTQLFDQVCMIRIGNPQSSSSNDKKFLPPFGGKNKGK
jgi:hypothetical protein